MDWKLLIIPLIPLAVWIIASIFQSLGDQKEKEKEQARARPAACHWRLQRRRIRGFTCG